MFGSNVDCYYFSFDKVSKWCYLKDGPGVNAIKLFSFITDDKGE
jgi:hypothetical protein